MFGNGIVDDLKDFQLEWMLNLLSLKIKCTTKSSVKNDEKWGPVIFLLSKRNNSYDLGKSCLPKQNKLFTKTRITLRQPNSLFGEYEMSL